MHPLAKHGEITQGLQEYGRPIENSGFDCEQDKNKVNKIAVFFVSDLIPK